MNVIRELQPVTVHAGETIDILVDTIEKDEIGYVRCMPLIPPPYLLWQPLLERSEEKVEVKLRLSNTERVTDVVLEKTTWAFEVVPFLKRSHKAQVKKVSNELIDTAGQPLKAVENSEPVDFEVGDNLPNPACGTEASNILVTTDNQNEEDYDVARDDDGEVPEGEVVE